MPRLAWSTFIDRHPAAHLVVGVLPMETTKAKSHLNLMAKLVARLAQGPYALTIDRQNLALEIHSIFERKSDANKIGDVLGAQRGSGYPSWASQQWFRMDSQARQAISDALKAT